MLDPQVLDKLLEHVSELAQRAVDEHPDGRIDLRDLSGLACHRHSSFLAASFWAAFALPNGFGARARGFIFDADPNRAAYPDQRDRPQNWLRIRVDSCASGS